MLDLMFDNAKQVDEGEVANYIPQLAKYITYEMIIWRKKEKNHF